jgi:hypothetical protein
MKVFLSWSGEISLKIATIFRDWLPSVIQSIIPYVSSEDIDKGARWSTDIAKELANSTFGILCVTKDNINASWLNFEAGALSKTMDKSFVCPFLFDIKRSEVDGPILQFQSTVFEKDDIKKLVFSLHRASNDEQLTDERLGETFDLWYPKLEEELNKIKGMEIGKTGEENTTPALANFAILEEILDLTRINQKLIRNPEGAFVDTVTKLNENFNSLHHRIIKMLESNKRKTTFRRFHPMMFDELISTSWLRDSHVGIQILLSFFKDDFPWLYDVGREVLEIIKGDKGIREKQKVVEGFMELLDISFEHPLLRDMNIINEEQQMRYQDIRRAIIRSFEKFIDMQNAASHNKAIDRI